MTNPITTASIEIDFAADFTIVSAPEYSRSMVIVLEDESFSWGVLSNFGLPPARFISPDEALDHAIGYIGSQLKSLGVDRIDVGDKPTGDIKGFVRGLRSVMSQKIAPGSSFKYRRGATR